MVEISEVVDRETLEAYLNGQPHEVAQAIAARCAMRLWPLLVQGLEWKKSPTRLIFAGQRAILISGVASFCPPPEIRQNVSKRAADAAFYAAHTVDAAHAADAAFYAAHTAHAAAYAAYAADAARAANAADAARAAANAAAYAARAAANAANAAAFWISLRLDLKQLGEPESVERLADLPLWADDAGDPAAGVWESLKSELRKRDEGWEVWFSIYEGFLAGKPLNWDMLVKIAMIPDEDWREDDVAYTNGVIAGIIADFAEAQTSHGEVIGTDFQTGLLRAVPLESQNQTYIETCVSAVEASAKRLLQSGGTNEYSGIADTLEILLEDIELDRGNAFSLFNAFSFALRRVKGAVESEIVPKLEQDARLGRLVEALDKGIADLSGSEYVQEGLANRRQFAADKVADLITDDMVGYAQASSMISADSLKEELARDVAPRDTNETAEEKAAREVRLYGRLLRVRRYLKEGNLEKASALVLRKGDEVLTAVDAVNKLKDMAELLEWVLRLL